MKLSTYKIFNPTYVILCLHPLTDQKYSWAMLSWGRISDGQSKEEVIL